MIQFKIAAIYSIIVSALCILSIITSSMIRYRAESKSFIDREIARARLERMATGVIILMVTVPIVTIVLWVVSIWK